MQGLITAKIKPCTWLTILQELCKKLQRSCNAELWPRMSNRAWYGLVLALQGPIFSYGTNSGGARCKISEGIKVQNFPTGGGGKGDTQTFLLHFSITIFARFLKLGL